MTIEAFLFLQRSDVAHFVQNPQPYAGLRQIFIDPGVVEDAVGVGLDPMRFDYRPLDVGRHLQSRVNAEAMNRALTIDHLLCRERERLFGSGLWQGWDQSGFRHFFVRALMSKYLGEVCERSFPERSIGLFRPTHPQQFYFDSFVSTDLFIGASERWQIVDRYERTANWVPDASAACFDFEQIERRVAEGRAEALTHIPTVYSQLPHYARELAQQFASNIELPSAFWDIPLRPDRLPLVKIASVPRRFFGDECAVYRERARHLIEGQLAGLLTHPHALRTQIDAMAERCYLQAVNYQGLVAALQGARPHFVLTEHDTGNGGPLFSVAAQLGSDITVLPHSSYPTELLPHSIRVTAIERDGFATPVRTVWGERVATRPVRFAPRKPPLVRPRVATVCLLLNTMFGQGVSHIDFGGMAAFHNALAQVCAQRGVRLLVRLKPNAAGAMLVSGALGVPPQQLQAVMEASIDELATAADVCVAYGEPTTASIEFLESGSYFMQVGEPCWPIDYLCGPDYLGDPSIPTLTGGEALQAVDALLVDTPHFQSASQRQQQAFAARLRAVDGRLFEPR